MTPVAGRIVCGPGLSTLIAAMLASACNPDRLLHAPAPPGSAALVVAYARGASASAIRQVAQADAARVRVVRASGAVLDTTFAFPASSNELRVRLELQVEQETEAVDVIIDLLEGGRILESGGDAVTLRQGQATTATIDAVLPFTGALSVGDTHACTIRSGTAWCWGNNAFLAVGSGATAVYQTRPVPVPGGPYTRISAGLVHTCALDDTGHAWCWGRNQTGALGDGTTVNSASPVPAAPALTFTDITAGAFTTCGLTSIGEVWCWGGQGGSLGNGTTGSSLAPVRVSAPAGVTFATISAGTLTTCAVSTSHDAYCWGSNVAGQVGDGTTDTRPIPTPVIGGYKFTSVIVANVNSFLHATCGVQTSGAALCWGYNSAIGSAFFPDSCTFGSAQYACSTQPRPVESTPGAYDFAVSGLDHICGQSRGGRLVCGGYNHRGQLGDGTRTPRIGTFEPAVPSGVGRFGAGSGFSCWLSRSDVYCWGYNAWGQTGTGEDGFEPDPLPVAGTWREIAANSCAASPTGSVSCWGPVISVADTLGTVSITPIGGPALTDITGSNLFGCGLDASGAAWCWGYLASGLGDGQTTTSRAPVRVAGGRTYSAISAGSSHACAVENGTGAVWCWGSNSTSALGTYSGPSSPVPVLSASATTYAAVATGSGFTCATTAQGEVWCWGFGRFGQLGFPVAFTPGVEPNPTPVTGLTGVSAISAGGSHACALSSGSVICWGANNFGQVGSTGTSSSGEPPTLVSGIAAVTGISAGGSSTCAVMASGQVLCWGQSRRVPQSTTVNPTPTPIPGIAGAVEVAVSVSAVVCALHSGGTVSCWGDNNGGAVGAPLPLVLRPTRVLF